MKKAGLVAAGIVLALLGLALAYVRLMPGKSSLPLTTVTFEEFAPSSTQNEGVVVIEALLDRKKSLGIDAKARMAWIEGKYKRLPAEGGTLVVEGDICRMSITLGQSEYWNTFGLVGHDPVVRIGIIAADGLETRTVGVLLRKSKIPK